MKKRIVLVWTSIVFGLLIITGSLRAATTGIDNTDKWSYGDYVGYINFKSDQGGDVTVTEDGLYGYVWGENIGWIKLALIVILPMRIPPAVTGASITTDQEISPVSPGVITRAG